FLAGKPIEADMPNNTHYRGPLRLLIQSPLAGDFLPDWILVWPVLCREVFIDHDDWFRADPVVISENPALQKRDSKGSEKTTRYIADVTMRAGAAGSSGLALDLKTP